MKKIKYKDLSWPLKVAVVVAWFDLAVWVLSFLVGFVLGAAGYGWY